MKWFKKKRILVPFDFSDESLHAIRVGMAMAEEPGDVHVVHVLHGLPVGVGFDRPQPSSDQRKIETKAAIEERMLNENIRDVEVEVLLGDPASMLTEYAGQIDCDLIVIPSHGYGRLTRMLIGSVAQDVVRSAKCPVLVLKD